MSYLKKRHNTYYARLGIPHAARLSLGRSEFVQSLKTTSEAIALKRSVRMIAEWKEQIANILASDTVKAEAVWWRNAHSKAESRYEIDTLQTLLHEKAEELEIESGTSSAQDYVAIAQGHTTPLSDYVESWYEVRLKEVSEKEALVNRQRALRIESPLLS